jgi:hypothetical protein
MARTQLNDLIARRLGEILGRDLGSIHLHTGTEADKLNRRFGSTALARGADIFFREGSYDPDSESGMELLAHETIHVCQQLSGRLSHLGPAVVAQPADDEFEREAEALARPVAALVRGNQDSISDAEFSALRDFRSRSKRTHLSSQPPAIQLSRDKIVKAANKVPPASIHPLNLGPGTCHEAALGWLLDAEGYTSPWKLLRYAVRALSASGLNRTADWLGGHVYTPSRKILRHHATSPLTEIDRGDILFVKGGHSVTHSMVVVRKQPGHVFIRGFNNAYTFNYPNQPNLAIPGEYDPLDRDICDPLMWDGLGQQFAGAELWRIPYHAVAQSLRTALQHWAHSNRAGDGHHGWEHAGHLCLPACPNAQTWQQRN